MIVETGSKTRVGKLRSRIVHLGPSLLSVPVKLRHLR